MLIRRADPGEGEALRTIAIAAKAHWGYELECVRAWAEQGDFSPAGLTAKEVFVADLDGRLVGWASLIDQGDVCWLDDLWVEPEAMRQGVGTQLFHRALERARQLGAMRVEWEAEPNATGFYEKMGAYDLRASRLSEWGRILRVMGVDLTPR